MSAGDHLEVVRGHGLFNHHGIDLGDNTVIHYLEGKEIIQSSKNEFRMGEILQVIKHINHSSIEKTLERAKSRVGEKNYNLLFNNCEHFANWCKTGFHRSSQIENWLKKSSLGAMAIGQILPAALLSGLNALLAKGLASDKSRKQAIELIKNLENLRTRLNAKLLETLIKVEIYKNKSQSANNTEKTKKENLASLLLKGQAIADELTAIENLEAKITVLFNDAIYKT